MGVSPWLPLLGAVAGAIIGSYLATLAIRWPLGKSASRGRSRCDACGMKVGAGSLIPVVSWLMQRGRCRACGARIDPIHPAMEVFAAAVGAIALVVVPPAQALAGMALGWALLLLIALDARYFWLPDRLTLPLIAGGWGAAVLGLGTAPLDSLIGAAAGFIGLWSVGEAYRRVRGRTGLGGGDPKLLAAIGAWCGWVPLPFVLLGAAVMGLAIALLRRARGQAVGATDRVAFGALMALAAWPIWVMMIAAR
ncbi:prepilin peptidase [Sphingomonas sp. AX6]|uniref:prepilin peptidase n=1 Tax=Sphingomonas sp. AX6 TaxID=2653171 RepID=UPI0012F16671|nr:A24 family peptidase [Sphingomonas sp. AX6]VXC69577.1 Prepilin peptidase [Sphingomonas sp. AX6]